MRACECDCFAHTHSLLLQGSIEVLGGALPAEHGHGVEYVAPPETLQRLRKMDPTNSFNPGVAGDATAPNYGAKNAQ